MKIGIYPGTFDPITHGHTDIITRSLRVFDKVVVAVAPNASKHPLFTLTERLEMIRIVMKEIKQVEVTHFDGCSWLCFAIRSPAITSVAGGRSSDLN